MRRRVQPEIDGKASHDPETETARTHGPFDGYDLTRAGSTDTPNAILPIDAAVRYLAELNRAERRKSGR